MQLPIEGFWGLARRVVHVRRQAARDAELGIVRMAEQPSDKWFSTAEKYRLEDQKRFFAALARRAHRNVE